MLKPFCLSLLTFSIVLSTVAGVAMAEPPTTKPTSFPSPADLIRKIKDDEAEKAKLLKVAFFDLKDPIKEKPAEFALFRDMEGELLHSLAERLIAAKNDPAIKAILINMTEPQFNLAQAQELRDVLVDIKQSGKRVFVYADGYDTTGYTLASGASDICMLAGGEVMLPGIGLEAQFLKGLFDKVGVQADFVQIGQYKGAEEPYTRTEASPELKGELNRLADALFEQVVAGIADHRKLAKADVQAMIADTMIMGDAAKKRGLVDLLLDQDGMRDLIASQIGGKIDLIKDYAADPKADVDTSNIFSLFAALSRKEPVSNKPAVALIPAEGVIVDGDGESSLFSSGGEVGSEQIRRTMRVALRDPNIKAVVLRIDSPGGSALASEVMWQAVRRLAKDKPVVISIGSMAASGGYYLASAGDTIYADPTAIVGSIGVVGGKFVLKDLFAKIGITNEPFFRGPNAGLFSSSEPWTDAQRKLVRQWMQNTYEQFTDRVMTTRKGKIKDIDQVARGRIFLASQAKELGMVDEIGGIRAALAAAAGKANLAAGEWDVRVLPQPKTLGDLLMGNDPQADSPLRPVLKLAADSPLMAIPPAMRATLTRQLRLAELLQQRPVILAMPFTLTVK